MLLEHREHQRRVAQRNHRRAPAPPARGSDPATGCRRRTARRRRVGAPGDAERAEARRGAAQQLLEADVLVRELQGLDQIALVRLAVDAEQADRRGDRRLRRLRRGALQPGQRLERPLVADLAERHRRIVEQRAVELGDAGRARRTRTAPCSRRAPRSPRCGRSLRRASPRASSVVADARVVADAPPAPGPAPGGRTRPAPCRAPPAASGSSPGRGCARRSCRRRCAADRSGWPATRASRPWCADR